MTNLEALTIIELCIIIGAILGLAVPFFGLLSRSKRHKVALKGESEQEIIINHSS